MKICSDQQCRRCGIDLDELAQLGRGSLEKHHVIAVRDGGHPHDPGNLHTLCYFCHREWHTWWEGHYEWPEYMAAMPFRVGVADVPAREESMPTEGCGRCGISESCCSELRGQRKSLKPFERVRSERDRSMRVCYWCQREWEIFWQCFRPEVPTYFRARPFQPLANDVRVDARVPLPLAAPKSHPVGDGGFALTATEREQALTAFFAAVPEVSSALNHSGGPTSRPRSPPSHSQNRSPASPRPARVHAAPSGRSASTPGAS